MLRWIARAAGGTNHRLNPGPATVLSRLKNEALAIVFSSPRFGLVAGRDFRGSYIAIPVSTPEQVPKIAAVRRAGYKLAGILVARPPSAVFVAVQSFDRIPNQRVKLNVSFGELGDDRVAHPRIPEFPQMVLDSGNRRLGLLRGKETADLIGHIGQSIMRHGAPSEW
jgi:hypothetical protein